MQNVATLKPDTGTIDAATITDEPGFFAPASTGLLDTLIAQYRQAHGHIETVANFMTGPDMTTAAGFFFAASREQFGRAVPNANRIFDAKPAFRALDANYWNRALDITDVMDYMPAARRKEWNEQIDAMTTPKFTEDTVKATMTSLLAQRLHFLAERVDGIFRGLSGEHVTNRPEGFSRRMIIDNAFATSFGMSVFGGKSDLIHDLRSVIAKFMSRDQPGRRSTMSALSRFHRHTGQWFDMDGGALRVRVYKKGTAHMEVHPDIAWQLNRVLAHLYPTAIPAQHRRRPAKKQGTKKNFRLIERPIPFSVLNPVSEANFERKESCWVLQVGYYDYSEADKHSRREIRRVLEAIGGVEHGQGEFRFDYDAGDTIGGLITLGAIPDHRSYQYFPTPGRIAAEVISLAGIKKNDRCLEPSAGQGALAKHMPAERTTCVEVSALHCEVLKAKGHQAEQADFLRWQADEPFNVICMNPPFSEDRAKAHLEHAASMLAPGGRLVAVLPASMAGQDLLQGINLTWSSVYDNEFAGTSVSVVILKAVKT